MYLNIFIIYVTELYEQIGLAMAVKNEYKMENTGGNVAFQMQGGTHTFTNVVAFQTNHGADRSKVSDGMQTRKISYCSLSK